LKIGKVNGGQMNQGGVVAMAFFVDFKIFNTEGQQNSSSIRHFRLRIPIFTISYNFSGYETGDKGIPCCKKTTCQNWV
jgi:hypothetical protein